MRPLGFATAKLVNRQRKPSKARRLSQQCRMPPLLKVEPDQVAESGSSPSYQDEGEDEEERLSSLYQSPETGVAHEAANDNADAAHRGIGKVTSATCSFKEGYSCFLSTRLRSCIDIHLPTPTVAGSSKVVISSCGHN